MDINTFKQPGVRLGNPDTKPSNVTLVATQTASVNQFYLDDSAGMASALGLVGGANSTEFDVQGSITSENLKKYLQTYALIICGYNFQSTVAAELSSNLSLIYPSIDGDSDRTTIFSAAQQSAMAQNQNLLNVNSPFVWTAGTALKMPVTSGSAAVFTLTFKVVDAIPYGALEAYLLANPIYRSNGNC
jgi:hypothetical protein